jgi:hypothetical protein
MAVAASSLCWHVTAKFIVLATLAVKTQLRRNCVICEKRSLSAVSSMAHPTLPSVPDLRERGWTLTLIVRLLGEPDDLRRNPYYKKAPPMRLYAADRVEAEPLVSRAAPRRGSRPSAPP